MRTRVEPLTEEWLRSVGFKWHQLERQPEKHWLLWLGDCLGGGLTSYEDLGVEVAYGSYDRATRTRDHWFCWLRGDSAGLYHRFIHVRALYYREELIDLVEGLTGHVWDPTNHLYGSIRTARAAEHIRREDERLDRQMMRERPWAQIERDESRGRALPEHKEAVEGKSK